MSVDRIEEDSADERPNRSPDFDFTQGTSWVTNLSSPLSQDVHLGALSIPRTQRLWIWLRGAPATALTRIEDNEDHEGPVVETQNLSSPLRTCHLMLT